MVTQNTISYLTQPSRFVCLNSTEPNWECSFERSEMWFRNVDVNCVFVSETWVFNILVLCRKVEGKYAGCCSFQSLTVCLWQRAFQRNFEGCCVCLVSNPNLPPPPTLVVFSCSAYKRRDMKPLVFLRKTTELHEGRLNIFDSHRLKNESSRLSTTPDGNFERQELTAWTHCCACVPYNSQPR